MAKALQKPSDASNFLTGAMLASASHSTFNNQQNNPTNTSETHIAQLTVNSAAKDAPGIAGDLREALANERFATQSNDGPV